MSNSSLYNVLMSTKQERIVSFIQQLILRRQSSPSQLARELGVSHATVSRWLSSKDVPNTESCHKLAELSGEPLPNILFSAGHMLKKTELPSQQWPAFREYARIKYADELDEDLIILIEDLIERRRERNRTKTS